MVRKCTSDNQSEDGVATAVVNFGDIGLLWRG